MHNPLIFESKDILSPLGTICAAFVGVVGSWLAFVRYPRQADSLKFRLKYVEDQLANLYGPLLGLLKEVEAAHSTIISVFALPATAQIDASFCSTQFDDKNPHLSKLYLSHLLPYNERILVLISNRRHLHGPFPPASFHDFLAHAGEARIRAALAGQPVASVVIDFAEHRPSAWPAALTAEVEAKVALLSGLQLEYRLRLDHDPAKHILLRNRFEIQAEHVWRGPYFWVELEVLGGRASRGEASVFLSDQSYDTFRRAPVREIGHAGVNRLIPEGGMLHFDELQQLVLRIQRNKHS